MTLRGESSFRSGSKIRAGVLALQGDFREHARVLASLGADVALVRRPEDLNSIDGLVIPGGESSVMDKLARTFGLFEPLRRRITDGMPVYGTCAGLIMLADRVLDASPGQQTLGGLNITARRNAFGSQLESFEADLTVSTLGDQPMHAVFIRAPIVEKAGNDVTVLAALDDGRVVAVEQGNLLGTAFHPEMAGDTRFHQRFLERL
ncbi:pyridoxal 5'-phosphate synthase glutaminase subunit PdxT [Humibacter ginsengiterrae]